MLSITLSGSWILNIFTLFDNVSAEILFGKASLELNLILFIENFLFDLIYLL